MEHQYYKALFRNGVSWLQFSVSREYSSVTNGAYEIDVINLNPPYAKYRIVHTGLIVELTDVAPCEENYPMKVFEIWAEGYAVTGSKSGAIYLGSAMSTDFKQACIELFRESRDADYFDAEQLTYWACKLFDNESDARNSFG